MSGKYLLDTNILIDIFKENERIIAKVDNAEAVFTTPIVLGELYFGAYNSSQFERHLAEAKGVSEKIKILLVDEAIAHIYGQIRFELKKKGNPIPMNDVWIAATAMEYNLTLLTGDKHFKAIDGLKLELWVRDEK